MGLQFKAKTPEKDNLALELVFKEGIAANQPSSNEPFLPAEWFPQSGVQLTWPHSNTDWCDLLPEVTTCYLHMAFEIASREKLVIVTPEKEKVEQCIRTHLPPMYAKTSCGKSVTQTTHGHATTDLLPALQKTDLNF